MIWEDLGISMVSGEDVPNKTHPWTESHAIPCPWSILYGLKETCQAWAP